jgi:hypothetical protein
MQIKIVALVILILTVTAAGQKNGARDLKDLNVDFMLRGYFYAGSRVQDEDALGGFSTSNNLPKLVDGTRDLPRNSLSLIALPEEQTVFGREFRGMKVLLVNTTTDQVEFSASDSRLYIIQEAVDSNGKWRPVEYLPSSWCGNSYHSVFLGPNEYWEFAAARLHGKQKTRLRFRLQVSEGEKTRFVYSNEFEGAVNENQFTVQQGHVPGSIMDPYNN